MASELNQGVFEFNVDELALDPANIARVARGYCPGRVRVFPSGDAAVIDSRAGSSTSEELRKLEESKLTKDQELEPDIFITK